MKTFEEELFGEKPKRSQGINSKRKGDKNENRLAKILSKWSSLEMVRVPRSGGLHWKNKMDVCGDLMSTNREIPFPFIIETKDYQKWNITPILRKNSAIIKVWNKLKQESVTVGKFPLLILRVTGENPSNKYTIFVERNWHIYRVLLGADIEIISIGHGIMGFDSIKFFKNVKYKRFTKFISGLKEISTH